MIGVVGGSITSRLDIFMVSAELGLNYAGIYSIAFYMVAIIDIPSRSITAISSPVAADALRAQGKIASLYIKPKKLGKFLNKLEERGYDGFLNVGVSEEVSMFEK